MAKNFKKSILIFIFAISFCAVLTPNAFAKQSPVADAGSNLYLDSKEHATLDGSASDSDGGTLTYYWDCDEGTLSALDVKNPVYMAPNVIGFSDQAIVTCTFTVKDEDGLSNSDTIKIYVNYEDKEDIVDIDVKTEAPTDIHSNQALLNGSYEVSNNDAEYTWFQYGFGKNYGTETEHQDATGESASFSEKISSLFLNGTYHYRAVVQDTDGNRFYGQDMIFTTNANYYNDGDSALSISRKVINITRQNMEWSDSMTACPSDILSFAITVRANGQDLKNVVIKDTLPAGLIYNGNLLVNASLDSSKDPLTGINIGTIKDGEIVIISYQARVGLATSFQFGTTELSANTVVYSDQFEAQTVSNVISVTNNQVSGASTTSPTDLATGLTNNIFTGSFFLPMLLIVIGSWFYFSGRVYTFADWLAKYL